jgi:predicted secreted protein
MKLFTQTKRKKLEVKPVKLSYYSHNNDSNIPLGIKSIPRKFKSGVKIVAVFLLVGTIISTSYYLISKYKFLELNEVIVYGDNKYVSTKEVQKSAEHMLVGKSLLTLKTGDYQKLLTKFL